MKKIQLWMLLILLSLHFNILKSQDMPFNYEKQWKKVDSLDRKSLPKSALEVIDKIHQKAVEEQNIPQHIKCIEQIMSHRSSFEENHELKTIKKINQEIEQSTNPVLTAMLQSILAELYVNYYDNNSYRISQRSYIEDNKEGSVETWDIKTILQKAEQLYWKSIQDRDILASEKVEKYNLILREKIDSINLRPTLYDLLAYRALDFYNSFYFKLIKANLNVQYHQKTYFSSVNKFKAIPFNAEHLPEKALIIYQNLLDIHPNNAIAYVHSNLNRLQYVYNYTIDSEKEIWYKTALVNFAKVCQDNEEWTMVQYTLAEFYRNLSADSKAHRQQNLEKALNCCNQAIEKYPDSYGGKNCINLKSGLLSKSLRLEIEEANLPKTNIPILAHHKNIDQLHIRVVKIDPKGFWMKKDKSQKEHLERLDYALSQSIVWSKTYGLSNDYYLLDISSELSINPLEEGFYLIITSNGKDFDKDKEQIAVNEYWVTNLSVLEKEQQPEKTILKILNRKTGTPIVSAKVNIIQETYNYQIRRNVRKVIQTLTTDKNGEVKVKNSVVKNHYFQVEIMTDNEMFIPKKTFYIKNKERKPKTNYHNYIFTDRAIYRPGQTVYFKGVLTVEEPYKDEKIIKKKQNVNISFLDKNYRKISSQVCVVNDFGSFSGSFMIPQQTLTGNFTLQTQHGRANIMVEAYKRPKFTVKIENTKENYKLNEKITLTGTATALAGYGIDGADVTYEVKRSVQFPFCRFYWGDRYEQEQIITTGNTITKDKGTFDIPFTLKPDLSIPKEREPIFYYTINVKVTDQNGETHEAQRVISAGYASFIPSLHVSERVNGNDSLAINMSVSNLDGQPMDIDGQLNIYQLYDFEKLYRKKLWNYVDTTVYEKATYQEMMPNFPFKDEDQLRNLTIKKTVFQEIIDKKHLSLKKDIKKWKPGAYKAEYIVEKDGERHISEQWFIIYQPDDKHIPLKEYAFFEALTNNVNSGENATILIGSADNDITAYIKAEDENHVIFDKVIKINQQQLKIDIPTDKDYTGNMLVSVLIMKDNRVYQWYGYIAVKQDIMPLKLNVEVNKTPLLPGGTEEWTITANLKEPVEILASMYDAALDQIIFMPQWNIYKERHHRYLPAPPRHYFNVSNSISYRNYPTSIYIKPRILPSFNIQLHSRYYRLDAEAELEESAEVLIRGAADYQTEKKAKMLANKPMGVEMDKQPASTNKEAPKLAPKEAQIRSNFNETAFFYPQLLTKDGKVKIKFVLPESLTTWNFRAFGHTKDLKTTFFTQSFKAVKPLMIEPNVPRFVRQNDKLTFAAKVVNLSDKPQKITVTLDVFDGITNDVVNEDFELKNNQKVIEIPAGQSKKVSFDIHVLTDADLLKYKLTAKNTDFSDGIEQYIPILSNIKMITETNSFILNQPGQTVLEIPSIEKEKAEKLTFEVTGNAAWYVMQAMPYIEQNNLKSALSIVYALYVNSLGKKIITDNPEIEKIFRIWEKTDTEALKSNLEKNQELKSIALKYTSWVLDAKDETEDKHRIAQFFNHNQLEYAFNQQIKKLQQMQLSNGGWCWYQDMNASFYVTQQIVLFLSQLEHLKAIKKQEVAPMIKRGIDFCANEVWRMYQKRKKMRHFNIEKYVPSSTEILYLYTLSLHPQQKLSKEIEKLNQKYISLIEKNKFTYGKMVQGYIALLFNELNKKEVAHDITKSLKEHTILDKSGLYWRDFTPGWGWDEAPLNFQALMIQVFDEVEHDKEAVEQMKLWLLNQKRTQKWETTSATAAAVYAFLSTGNKMISTEKPNIRVVMGDEKINLKTEKSQAGTGYLKKIYTKNEVKPNMKSIEINKKDNTVSWGAVYFQYKKPMAEVEAHAHGVSIQKKYYIVDKTNDGEQLTEVSKNNPINIGDKIKVKLTLTSEHNLEFVHLQDGLAAGFEQGNSLSHYRYQDGLFYYQSMQDASADFFIEWMRKGTYVFEYELIADKKGVFSAGIATLQSMYAPEFAAHSKGYYIEVK